tara:strand:- start:2358 stop:3329 length:972 start_codon:yes stop_codon:yes gene_type:complete
MAYKFGRFGNEGVTFEEQVFHKNQTVTSASIGVNHVLAIKDQRVANTDIIANTLTTSAKHWAFIHTMFYSSGSSKIAETNPDEVDKFNSIYHSFMKNNDLKPYFNTKFYGSSSIFYIPQQYFDQRIKPGSFTLTARTGSSTNTTKEIIIKDDNNGNLYSTNAHHSQSEGSLSSQNNYIGNIFYDLGVAVLNETSSWSGSVNYTDVGKTDDSKEQTYKYWDMKFNSSTQFFTSTFSVKVSAKDFNISMNPTSKPELSGSIPNGTDITTIANIRNELTGSGWKPYFNQIQLYRNTVEEPIIVANLPRAIKIRDDIDLIITFRIDH